MLGLRGYTSLPSCGQGKPANAKHTPCSPASRCKPSEQSNSCSSSSPSFSKNAKRTLTAPLLKSHSTGSASPTIGTTANSSSTSVRPPPNKDPFSLAALPPAKVASRAAAARAAAAQEASRKAECMPMTVRAVEMVAKSRAAPKALERARRARPAVKLGRPVVGDAGIKMRWVQSLLKGYCRHAVLACQCHSSLRGHSQPVHQGPNVKLWTTATLSPIARTSKPHSTTLFSCQPPKAWKEHSCGRLNSPGAPASNGAANTQALSWQELHMHVHLAQNCPRLTLPGKESVGQHHAGDRCRDINAVRHGQLAVPDVGHACRVRHEDEGKQVPCLILG